MSKHTPGPWHFAPSLDDTYVVCESDDNGASTVALVYAADAAKPDARLIAAAPDLLAALEKVLAAYEAAREPGHGTILIDEARAALAKARGE